ncbi:methylated-DNA--[protein]-cysteine S-methyltransferase [Cupriavidus sp. WKF15]|uniref:methylated-DNA--[protein]-cysteine S-methyltransferase n=1 Tax=Cupriavidus sp. WKF15 TaxID=3032282 RepID=UPI0023E14D39|nr:methylated-DNA--[protein]-cysteine S-methyltransferase [Cupriavidus sp. WKF15]WER49525.1 methylated-DNA--[protein]-cysteine S-methyltransferase [Cupriavidus sp. WKF15]
MTSYRLIDSPLGAMLLRADGSFLTGVYFEGQKYYPRDAQPGATPASAGRVFDETAAQIAAYFDGKLEAFSVPMRPAGTAFQLRVWEALRTIPFGATVSYGQLTRQLELPHGHVRAVGGAVGRNPLSVIVPCHRVLGADGDLTGYAGGTDRKRALLRLESHAAAARLPIMQQSALALA